MVLDKHRSSSWCDSDAQSILPNRHNPWTRQRRFSGLGIRPPPQANHGASLAALAVLSVMAVCLIERIAHSAVLQSANERFTSKSPRFPQGPIHGRAEKLDDVLTDLEFTTDRGVRTVINEAKNAEFLLYGFDRGFRELVVYTPPGSRRCDFPRTLYPDNRCGQSASEGRGGGVSNPGTRHRMHSSSPWEPVAEARKQDSLLRGSDLHSLHLPFLDSSPGTQTCG